MTCPSRHAELSGLQTLITGYSILAKEGPAPLLRIVFPHSHHLLSIAPTLPSTSLMPSYPASGKQGRHASRAGAIPVSILPTITPPVRIQEYVIPRPWPKEVLQGSDVGVHMAKAEVGGEDKGCVKCPYYDGGQELASNEESGSAAASAGVQGAR